MELDPVLSATHGLNGMILFSDRSWIPCRRTCMTCTGWLCFLIGAGSRVIGHPWPARDDLVFWLELDPVSSAIHGLHGMTSSW